MEISDKTEIKYRPKKQLIDFRYFDSKLILFLLMNFDCIDVLY